MKKLLALTSALVFSFSLYTPYTITISAQDTTILNSHGLYFGKLNHLKNKEAFDKALAQGGYVIVKFGANWCPPCRKLEPVLQQVAKDFPNVLVIEVNIELFRSISSHYGVRNIPATFLFKDGKQVSRTVGFRPKSYWATTIKNSFGL